MKILYFLLISCVFLAADDFITKFEYAKMLYENPRGIGCNKCHGNKAQGSTISKYKIFDKKIGKYVEKSLRAPKISDLDFPKFQNALKNSRGMMPSYFLTDTEIYSIYEYIQTFNKDKK